MPDTGRAPWNIVVPLLGEEPDLVSAQLKAMRASIETGLDVNKGIADASETAASAAAASASAAATSSAAASTKADTALSTATDAKTTADGIAATAQAADTKAGQAISTADDALSVAQSSTSATMSRGNVARDTDGVPYLIPAVIAPPLTGAGSPVGVVTPAAPGQEYTDANGTNGAWKWLSTGTTKTSWIVTVGDTGMRNVAAQVLPDSQSGDTVRACRTTQGGVYVQVSLVARATWPSPYTLTMPAGFRAESNQRGLASVNGGTPSRMWATGGAGTISLYSVAAGNTVLFSISSVADHTDIPWPTALPGTPA